MRVLQLLYLEHLTEDEVAEYECSDRIWLSQSDFEEWVTSGDIGVITLLRLTNDAQQTVSGFPHSVHSQDPATLYAPSWMCRQLDADDNVTISRFEASMCTGIVVQPHTSDHLIFEDPAISLRNAFEHYSCLTPGTEIPLWIGYPFHVTIVSLTPNHETLCIRDCELTLELMPPLDSVLQDSLQPEPEPEPEPEPANIVLDEGMRLGGTTSQLSRRELAAAAALRRASQKN